MPRLRVTAALLFVAKLAAAEPDGPTPAPSVASTEFSFTWRAPEPCPSQTDVLARAERLVGHAVTHASAGSPLELIATVEAQAGETWQLVVLSAAPGAESRRVVTAGSCDELGDAMALWIALAIDPDYAKRSGPGPAHVNPGVERAPASPPPASPARASRPAAPSPAVRAPAAAMPVRLVSAPWLVSAGAAGVVWLGRLPGVAPGVAVFGSLSRDERVFTLELGLFPPERAVQQSVSGDLSLATLAGSLGYAFFDDSLMPYAGLELDLLHGVGQQVDHPASAAVWLLGFDAGVRLSSAVHRSLRLFVDGHASVLAERARFHVEPDTELFRPAQVGAQFGLGAELRLR